MRLSSIWIKWQSGPHWTRWIPTEGNEVSWLCCSPPSAVSKNCLLRSQNNLVLECQQMLKPNSMGHAWDCCAAAAAVKMHLQSYLWRTFARGWFFHEIVLVVFVSAGCRDYSQMWGIIRNNNNIITIVCFDSKKLLEPCRKFAPPQIPQYIYGVNYKTSNNNNNNSEPQHHHEKRHDHHWTWFLAILLFPCTVSVFKTTTRELKCWQAKRSFQFERSRTISNSRTRPGWCQQLLYYTLMSETETVPPLMVCCSTWRDFIAGDNGCTFVLWIFPVLPPTTFFYANFVHTLR